MAASAPSQGRLPDFLVIGAPKSGTTSLAKWLDARDDVFVPRRKELHFFTRAPVWERGVEWYAAQFADAGDGVARVGEATPTYLSRPAAAERIAATIPAVRMIAILREPVERAWSHYAYDRDIGRRPPSFDQIVATAGTPGEHAYVRIGRYAQHLRRMADAMAREQLLVLWFDDLRDRPGDVWQQVCQFLGVDAAPQPDEVGTAHNRHYRLRVRGATDAMRRWRMWTRFPRLSRGLDRVLRNERGYEPLPAALRARLRDAFADDDAALAEWLGRPLPAGWDR